MIDYTIWGNSELIEKCENAESFAEEVAHYLATKKELTIDERYLEEKARKLAGLKIK